MDTFNIGYPKFWFSKNLEKSGFCTCHLQKRLTLWCVIVMVQTMCQIKAKELHLTPS